MTSYCVLYVLSFTVCKYCMYYHLLYVNKQFVINDELLYEKSNQESGPFLIPLVVVLIGTTTSAISNSPSGSSNWN